jgi:hypothetical protein
MELLDLHMEFRSEMSVMALKGAGQQAPPRVGVACCKPRSGAVLQIEDDGTCNNIVPVLGKTPNILVSIFFLHETLQTCKEYNHVHCKKKGRLF